MADDGAPTEGGAEDAALPVPGAAGESGAVAGVPVVGIGASAGGLEALREFFAGHPERTGMAFVVIQHLDPTHESLMAQLIERYTRMGVRQAEGGEALQADEVYVIPPGHGLAVKDRVLHLTEFTDPRGMRRPIDDFFHSLAEDCGDRAACVILSGTGADGSNGLRAIKEHGGICVAQDPESARYDGMPYSAIGTGLVDVVARPGEVIASLAQFFGRGSVPGDIEIAAADGDHIDEICGILTATLGHDFSRYKRSTLTRRIARRMQVLGIEETGEYIAHLGDEPGECDALFRDLLINVTRFFRDPDEFRTLRSEVIDPLVRAARNGQEIRVWVPGCSSGEEAYTLAMLFHAAAREQDKRPYIQIFATDIDDKMLSIARAASYPLSAQADIPTEYRDAYTIAGTDSFTLSPKIRDMVRFSLHSLIKDPPFSRVDLLSCRNLLIYFDEALQKQVVPLFHFALREGGALFLGSSESVGRFEDLFAATDQTAKIFRRRDVKSRYLPRLGPRTAPGAARSVAAPRRAADPRESGPEQAALRRIAEGYAPVSMLVDGEGTLLDRWGRVGRYLDFPDRGDRQVLVPVLARPGLRGAVASVLHKARGDRRRAASRGVEVRTDFGTLVCDVFCEPVDAGTFLLVIRETGQLEPFAADELDEIEDDEGQMRFLEEELLSTRQKLRSTVEELETTNEELKSSNEEMMSMNEELQSTNEELTTVNDELKSKVDQLLVANADLENFLASTDIAVIVVDRDLRVRNYTRAVQSVFPLGGIERGRALSSLESRFDGTEHLRAVADAAGEGTGSEWRATAADGQLQLIVRAVPYRRSDGEVDGASLVFTDVTHALSLERDLDEQRERLRLALEVAQIGVWEYDPATDVTTLDATERRLLDMGEGESGDRLDPILSRLEQEDRDRVNGALRRAMDGETDFDEVFRLTLHSGRTRWLHGLGKRIRTGRARKFVGVTYDVTAEQEQLSQRELMIREMNHRIKNLFAIIAAMVSICRRDAEGLDDFAETLRTRIHALGRAHSLTNDGHPSGQITMRDLVAAVIEPMSDGQDVNLGGTDLQIDTARLTPLALIFYEWATNAAKYGALSTSGGRLSIDWQTAPDGAMTITWDEEGGQGAVTDGAGDEGGSGFGTTLIAATSRQLGAEVEGSPTGTGYRRSLVIPAR